MATTITKHRVNYSILLSLAIAEGSLLIWTRKNQTVYISTQLTIADDLTIKLFSGDLTSEEAENVDREVEHQGPIKLEVERHEL